ncbi:hypothetical protein J2S53_001540 [Actinopolyspora lacussalsi]|nr:hypothetical protein [Actinopolyspora lacussalsi]
MADETAGFTGASAALGVIREENSWIQQQISAGQLTMEPQAADNAAALYEHEALEADRLADSATGLQQVPGLGEYLSGEQLANEFGKKAANCSTGADGSVGTVRR